MAKVRPICGFTWIWLTPSIWYSTGSSIVMIFRSGILMRFIALYSVVVLPLPVGPVTRKIPCGFEVISQTFEYRSSGNPMQAQVHQRRIRFVEDAHDDALAIHRRQRRNAQIDFPAQHLQS